MTMAGRRAAIRYDDWTAEQIAFARWLGDPYRQGTKKDFADMLNVAAGTLRKWEQIPGFLDLVYEEAVKNVNAHWPDMYKAAIQKATGGDMRAFELLLKVTGKYVDEQVISHQFGQQLIADLVGIISSVCGECPNRNRLAEELEAVSGGAAGHVPGGGPV
jgi:hypothetical protein